jgi:hypothetical protein
MVIGSYVFGAKTIRATKKAAFWTVEPRSQLRISYKCLQITGYKWERFAALAPNFCGLLFYDGEHL